MTHAVHSLFFTGAITMKTNIIAWIGCLLLDIGVKAQPSTEYYNARQSSGIYLSSTDYEQGKLTLPADCQQEKSKVRMNDFLDKPYLTVIHQGKKYTFTKDSIFGFRSCEGHDFRLFHRRLFEIEELKSIIIYRQLAIESGGGAKGVKQVARFYFSTSVNSVIMPLSRPALEHAFPHNEKLHDLLDAWLQSNQDAISSYDAHYHTFKINRLLQASI